MGRPAADMTGQRFGRLVVLERAENQGKVLMWRCECDCGTEKTVRGDNLRAGTTRSCGCLRRETLDQLKATTYVGHHARLRRQRGRAADQICVDCGGPAAEWSYRNGCPDELSQTLQDRKTYEPRRVKYCPHLECYEPRCRPCHTKYDMRKAQTNAA